MISAEERFLAGLDFILPHLSGSTFPRKMSTAVTQGAQFMVNRKQEIIDACRRADYLDCRINAYPALTESGERQQEPDFLFIDLDKGTFKSPEDHRRALNETLRNVKRELSSFPTVVWSGNGYHIYCPIQNFVLENVTEFAKFDRPSVGFLRWVEHYLSEGKSDPAHKPSFKACLIRIPGTYNSKCVTRGEDGEVKMVHRWNGARPRVTKELLKSYLNFLTEESINELRQIQRISTIRCFDDPHKPSQISWIEVLLQTPIADYRKNAVALIIAPYLITIRKMSFEQAKSVIDGWLARCGELQRLDPSIRQRVKLSLDDAIQHRVKPMKLSTLQSRNPDLYSLLVSKLDSNGEGKNERR